MTINEPHVNSSEEDDFFGADGPAEQTATATTEAPDAPAEAQADAQQADAPAEPPADAQPAPAPERKQTSERPYVVLRELKLTESTLERLLDHVRNGGAEPPVAYIELERLQARHEKHAVSVVYKNHRQRLGEVLRLAAVSAARWHPRTAQPRQQPVEEKIDIL